MPDLDSMEKRAREIWASELRRTAPKGEYVARTFETSPSESDERIVAAIFKALAERGQPDAGEGYILVPVEPTLAMLVAGAESISDPHYEDSTEDAYEIWSAMLRALPASPARPAEEE